MRYLAVHERAPRGTFDFPIELYRVDAAHPRYEMPFHWHIECELLLVWEGTLALSVDGEEFLGKPGDCFFLPSGAIHGGKPDSCFYKCLVFDMERFLQDSSVCRRKFASTLGSEAHIFTSHPAGSSTAQIVDALVRSMEEEKPGYEFVTTGLLWQFIGTVLEQRLYAAASEETRVGRQRTEQMKSVLRRIRRDYAAPLTLDELAAEAGMNPPLFLPRLPAADGSYPYRLSQLLPDRVRGGAALCRRGQRHRHCALMRLRRPGLFRAAVPPSQGNVRRRLPQNTSGTDSGIGFLRRFKQHGSP